MKRQALTGLVWLVMAMQVPAQFVVSGTIVDQNGDPLQGAGAVISELNRGGTTDEDGVFSIGDVPRGTYRLSVSFIGYETRTRTIEVTGDMALGEFSLVQRSFLGEEVIVRAYRAGEETPVAYTNVDEAELETRDFGQDVPALLSTTPSVVTTSDAGHGIGYSSMRIRGTDANRINVTINGIPLNDAETHAVFWVDLPDFVNSVDNIQVQRGVGTSTNGAAAFGGTVNFQTRTLEKEPYATYDGTAGSFNTFRNSVAAGTGLINGRFAVDLRLSDMHSDGYIDRSWTDMESYYVSAGYFGESTTVKFLTFGGFEELYQAWGGVPSGYLDTARTYNPMGAYTDAQGKPRYYDNQIDHYDQIHYQLHFSHRFTRSLHLNASLHYTDGGGYYEEFVEAENSSGEGLFSFYNLDAPQIGDSVVSATDFVRRKWVTNDFFGGIASLDYRLGRHRLVLGGGWNRYLGDHFGVVKWARIYGDNPLDHHWYDGTGEKTDWNLYGKTYLSFTDELTTFVDLQVRSIRHAIGGTDAFSRDVGQTHDFFFFNPKVGLTYRPAPGQQVYASVARSNREPNRNNYTDAGPASPEPQKESMIDYEAGYSLSGSSFRGGVNFYYMDYRDQLVLTGQINEVGYPIMTNVEESYRAGVEMEASVKIPGNIRWAGNLTLSRNRIEAYVNYVDNWDYWSDPDNEPFQVADTIGTTPLAFSPSVVASSRLAYEPFNGASVSLISKYVDKQYIDNTGNEAYRLDPYFVNDLRIGYTLDPSWTKEITFSFLVANLFDHAYETNAWLYRYYSGGEEYSMDGFYPQAGRHFMAGITIKL